MSDYQNMQKSSLLLLLEALEREQTPEPEAVRYAKSIRVSEFTMDVARHATDCLPELRKLFPKEIKSPTD